MTDELKPCPSEWQPIETAPKDGDDQFIIWSKKEGINMAYLCYSTWVNSGCSSQANCHKPTHWMPVPQPPTQKEKNNA